MQPKVTTLDNGFRVVTDARSDFRSVALGVWIGTGSRFETEAQNGIAHFLEHMAFKGTKRRSALDIALEVEDRGGQMNAFTGREQTAYHLRLLAEDLPMGIDLLGDILLHSSFESEELERERGVILQEIGQCNDTPNDVIFDHFQETAYQNQSVGRPILGREKNIKAYSSNDFQKFIGDHYQPEKMVLAVAGKLDHDNVVAMAEKAFSGLKSSTKIDSDKGIYTGGSYLGERDTEQTHIILGFPGVEYDQSLDYLKIELLSSVLGGGMSSRLFQEIREKRGLAYSVFSFNQSYRDCGLFGIYAGTGPDEVAELIPALCYQLKESSYALSDDELNRSKAQIRAAVVMSLESLASRISRMGRQIIQFDRMLDIDDTLKKIEAITCNDLHELMEQLLQQKPTLSAIGPLHKLEKLEDIHARLVA